MTCAVILGCQASSFVSNFGGVAPDPLTHLIIAQVRLWRVNAFYVQVFVVNAHIDWQLIGLLELGSQFGVQIDGDQLAWVRHRRHHVVDVGRVGPRVAHQTV